MKQFLFIIFLFFNCLCFCQTVYDSSKVPKFKPFKNSERVNETLIAKRPISKNTNLTFTYCICNLKNPKIISNEYEYVYYVEYRNSKYNQIVSKSPDEKLFKSWLIFDRVSLSHYILDILKSNNYIIIKKLNNEI